LRECPACGQEQLRKLISAAAFRLKGGGWYETDFKNGNKRNLVASGDKDNKDNKDKAKEDSGKAKDNAGGAATGDSKPASGSAAAAG
jgi:hypothetical protein